MDSTPHRFDNRFFAEVRARGVCDGAWLMVCAQTMEKGTVCPGAALHKGEVLAPSRHLFRLQSDYVLARDPR